MYLAFDQILFLFFLFAFLGWLLETTYRSLRARGLVNPGFLAGPYVPLYGVCAILLFFLFSSLPDQPLMVRFFIYLFMMSLVEYITGVMLVLVFKKRYWDYTDESLNIRGHVCLLYSLYWGGLSLLFEKTFYPLSLKLVSVMDMELMCHLNLLFGAVIFLDLLYSSRVIPRVLLTARRRFPFGRMLEEYLERLSAMPLIYAPAVQDNIRRLAGFLQERNWEAGIFQRRLRGRYRRTRFHYRRRLAFIADKLPMRGAMLLKEKIFKIVKG